MASNGVDTLAKGSNGNVKRSKAGGKTGSGFSNFCKGSPTIKEGHRTKSASRKGK